MLKPVFSTVAILALITTAACSNNNHGAYIDIPAQPVDRLELTAPASTDKIFQNSKISVIEVRLDPGQRLPAHTANERIIYALTDGEILFTEGRNAWEEIFAAGEAHYHGRGIHAVQNITDTPIQFLIFERRRSSASAPDQPDLAHADFDDENNRITHLFANSQARVSRVELPAGEELKQRDALDRAVYALSGYRVRYENESGISDVRRHEAGSIHWHDADRHTLVNVGDSTARFVVIEWSGGI
ncbi:MAG: hypothetical protein VYC34_04210 [Planctomycetota bacterium]|nr:hypothetical protein [Planctomycetota bacterium]